MVKPECSGPEKVDHADEHADRRGDSKLGRENLDKPARAVAIEHRVSKSRRHHRASRKDRRGTAAQLGHLPLLLGQGFDPERVDLFLEVSLASGIAEPPDGFRPGSKPGRKFGEEMTRSAAATRLCARKNSPFQGSFSRSG
jgi:hypothetical protein